MDRRGIPNTGGCERHTCLAGPIRRPSSSAVIAHLFAKPEDPSAVCAHMHSPRRRREVQEEEEEEEEDGE